MIEPYIVDFYCPAATLVVEIDGMSHVGRREADERRTAALVAKGLRVIRYTNDQIIADVDAVADDIARQIAGVQKNRPDPPPTPPCEGGG